MTNKPRPKPIKAKLLLNQREVRTKKTTWAEGILYTIKANKPRTLMGDEVE
jgi:hypothetical protein